MKKLTNILKNWSPAFQGVLVGLFVTMGLFNTVDGFFFSKNTWQLNCGVYQIIIGTLIFRS
jgi:hypothetical protein